MTISINLRLPESCFSPASQPGQQTQPSNQTLMSGATSGQGGQSAISFGGAVDNVKRYAQIIGTGKGELRA